ncbi:putative disease resistance RPP13-like protein 1 [Carex rostrata]
MASGLFSSIQSLSTKLLQAIRGTPSTSAQQQDPSSPVTDQQKSVREDLEKLSRMLRRIQVVLHDAEEREIHDESVQLWLAELRGVGYQAEDVLDEFYYEVLRSIVESGDAAIEAYQRDGGTKRKFAEMYPSSSFASYSFTITKASIPDDMAKKIKSIIERFEDISNARRDLHLREEDGARLVIGPQIPPHTSSHVDERAIFGREEEKEKIISLLNPSDGPDFMVLPIVGMGGFGKTTLAQLVYNSSRICRLFNKRCWVSVSEDFDLVRLTKAIVESVSNSPCEFSQLSILQDVLKEKIRGLGLFLVLDDVWNEKRDLWECFRVGFFGAKFVRILTTTRNTSVAKIMQTMSHFQLGSLHEENCWLLFKHCAFGNREASDNANLHEIGRGIVKKCKGAPLAIKALGGILHYEMDEEKWREILESDISEIDETGEIMPALRSSYQKLPRYIKPCFLYLSMFPKGKRFEKDMVVRLWMAQGYINENTRNLKTLEEIGSEYFDELQGRSLVDCAPSTKYLLHDLIHDLARSISQEAYRPVLENDQQCNGARKVYHLYLTEQDKFLGSFLAPNNYCSIRTFVNTCPTRNFCFDNFSGIGSVRAIQLSYFFLPTTLGMLKHLRYLSIENSHMETLPEILCLLYNLQSLDVLSFYLQELPENIKNLINLWYIQLCSGKIQQLPESVFLLRNLRTLSLRYCTELKELPKGIEQLTRLRILDLPVQFNLPSGIGKLTSLKQLSGHFSVMDHNMIGGLGELKNMNKLSGLLCLKGHRNISDVEYSRNTNLASKTNLHKLILNFQENCSMMNCSDKLHLHLTVNSRKNAKNENDEKMQEVVLQSLQPHGNLTELAILNYGGRIGPSWLRNPLLPKLTTLILNFCTELNFFPSFGQLPYLRFLYISGNTGVRNMGNELNTYSLLAKYGSPRQPTELNYPSLELLSLRNMHNLVEWQAHDGDFPSLKKLVINNCPKLWKITTIPQEVRVMLIRECGCHKLQFSSESNIENVLISNCPDLVSVHSMGNDLPSLKSVVLHSCRKLWIFPTIPEELKMLDIQNCGFREIMLPSKSENLIISNCLELFSINWRDNDLYSIVEVTFEYCPKLKLLTFPAGIIKLKIHKCGFREITTLICENLNISNCLELISINWKYKGLSVREVSFEYCPKLRLLTCPSVIRKLKIHECGFREIMFQSVSGYLSISNCIELISINCMDRGLNSIREVSFKYCPKLELQFPVKDVLHFLTQRAEIYDCPRMDLGERYVYQRDTEIKALNLFGNNEIRLSHASVNSIIPLLEKPFTLFLTKEDFLGVELLTWAPSVQVSCQSIMLNLASLVILEIYRCRKVISVAGLDNLSNLKCVNIFYCPELCDWNDQTLPLSLESLRLGSCDKLSSFPLLWVQNHSKYILNELLIIKCPRLAVLEGFHSLMKLKTVKLLHCRNISISPANESLQFRPLVTKISGCPLMREWCQRNSITYRDG